MSVRGNFVPKKPVGILKKRRESWRRESWRNGGTECTGCQPRSGEIR